jgi:hypothetical protein
VSKIDEDDSDFSVLTAEFSDRRRDSPMPVILELVTQIHKSQKALDDKLTHHMVNETQELAEAIAILMKSAFPEGDPDGHRRHHELVIKQAEEKAKFWHEMRVAAAKWAGLGLLAFLASAIFVAIKTKLGLP